MKRETKDRLCMAAVLLAAFILWTLALCFVDVQPIGPRGTKVGFAELNGFVHGLTGVHMSLYVLTDRLSILPLCFVLGFAVLGLMQWIKRKRICRVDRSIIALGCFYFAVTAAYLLFEMLVINYRPVLIDGIPEASYPSSTAVLVLCVMSTAIMQIAERVRNRSLKCVLISSLGVYIAFMLAARLLSGVHWFSDIVGGVLLSAGLIMMYRAFVE